MVLFYLADERLLCWRCGDGDGAELAIEDGDVRWPLVCDCCGLVLLPAARDEAPVDPMLATAN